MSCYPTTEISALRGTCHHLTYLAPQNMSASIALDWVGTGRGQTISYRLCMRALAMPPPVLHHRGVVGVGVAVVAEVRAGVVLADVLGHDASTGEALAGVFQAGMAALIV